MPVEQMMFTQEPCYHTLEFWEKKFIYIYIYKTDTCVYVLSGISGSYFVILLLWIFLDFVSNVWPKGTRATNLKGWKVGKCSHSGSSAVAN